MITDIAARTAVSSLTGHLLRWISNLSRAGKQRKLESRASLKRVLLAVRKTAVYRRSLDEGAAKNYERESDIAMEWTALAVELEQLGLAKLAKKCRVMGWHWEQPGRFDADFLHKAGVRFDEVERLALKQIAETGDRK